MLGQLEQILRLLEEQKLAALEAMEEDVDTIESELDDGLQEAEETLCALRGYLTGYAALLAACTLSDAETQQLRERCRFDPQRPVRDYDRASRTEMEEAERELQAVQEATALLCELRPALREHASLGEMRAEQSRTGLVIRRRVMRDLIEEIADNYRTELVWDHDAVDALRHASESFVVDLLHYAGMLATHAGRSHLEPGDLRLARAAPVVPRALHQETWPNNWPHLMQEPIRRVGTAGAATTAVFPGFAVASQSGPFPSGPGAFGVPATVPSAAAFAAPHQEGHPAS